MDRENHSDWFENSVRGVNPLTPPLTGLATDVGCLNRLDRFRTPSRPLGKFLKVNSSAHKVLSTFFKNNWGPRTHAINWLHAGQLTVPKIDMKPG